MQSVFRWGSAILIMAMVAAVAAFIGRWLETSGYDVVTATFWRGYVTGAGNILAIWFCKVHRDDPTPQLPTGNGQAERRE